MSISIYIIFVFFKSNKLHHYKKQNTCLIVQNKKSKSGILLENMESHLMPRISFNQSDAFVQILLIIEPY